MSQQGTLIYAPPRAKMRPIYRIPFMFFRPPPQAPGIKPMGAKWEVQKNCRSTDVFKLDGAILVWRFSHNLRGKVPRNIFLVLYLTTRHVVGLSELKSGYETF